MSTNRSICPNCSILLRYHPENDMSYRFMRCSICAYTKEVGKKYMLSLKELNPKNLPLDEEESKNLNDLLEKINKVRVAYGFPLTVTSGFRSIADQQRIYDEKNRIRQSQGLTVISVPLGSQHLYGRAVDILDNDGNLKTWIKNNIALMEEIGFWFEDFAHCSNWVHFQIVPYKSWSEGKSRFFIP